MSRLIDTNVAYEALTDYCCHTTEIQHMALSDAPNKVPGCQDKIIHCIECKHCIREDYDVYAPYGFYNTYWSAFCDKHWDKENEEYISVMEDDFCSFGKRKVNV